MKTNADIAWQRSSLQGRGEKRRRPRSNLRVITTSSQCCTEPRATWQLLQAPHNKQLGWVEILGKKQKLELHAPISCNQWELIIGQILQEQSTKIDHNTCKKINDWARNIHYGLRSLRPRKFYIWCFIQRCCGKIYFHLFQLFKHLNLEVILCLHIF